MRHFPGPVRQASVAALWSLSLLCISCGDDPAAKRDKHMQQGDAYFADQEYKKAIMECNMLDILKKSQHLRQGTGQTCKPCRMPFISSNTP